MNMNIVHIINKKSKGLSLSEEEINYFVNGVTNGEIKDYQSSALLMAIKIKGLTNEELIWYARALVNSGETLPLRDDLVDKHSTGGVGDKTSIALLPVLGAMGLKVFKMSGRGLGFTGGTIDKLESIEGFKTELKISEVNEMVDEIGISITAQTPNLTPADGILYSLRDVTGTVDSLELIAASIISKKVASGARNILIDLKVGTGAFIPTLKEAQKLAKLMKLIAKDFDRNLFVLFSSMDQPLGYMAGNKIEVQEAISLLKNDSGASSDFQRLVRKIAFELYSKAKDVPVDEAAQLYDKVIQNGSAYELQKTWMRKHGVEHYHRNTRFKPRFTLDVKSIQKGYVTFKDVKALGDVLVELKAGRRAKGDELDYNAGILFKCKAGDIAYEGEPLFTITSNEEIPQEIADKVLAQYQFNDEKPEVSVILGEVRW